MATPTDPPKRGLSRNARIGIALAVMFVLVVLIGRCTTNVVQDGASSRSSSESTVAEAAPTSTVSAADLQRAADFLAIRQDPANYKPLTEREFAMLVKDPDAHKGDLVAIFGQVTQFDAATGNDAFRVNTGPLPPGSGERYSQNSIVTAQDPSSVADVVEDDVLKMFVEVTGAHTYETSMGGKSTAPLFRLYIVENLSRQLEEGSQAGG